MSKLAGLSQQQKKYLEIVRFPKNIRPCSALLFRQAISFFHVFKLIFGHGSKTIKAFNNESKTFSEHNLENTEDLSVALVNYHFSIEMMLKGFICLKIGSLKKELQTHDLMKLLKEALPHYSVLSKIDKNLSYKLTIQELSGSFDIIRYGEGTISLSNNKRTGWISKMPLQELSEIFDGIFIILFELYEEVRKQP